MRVGEATGSQLDRAIEEAHGLFHLAALEREEAEVVPGLGLLGVERERLLVERARLLESPAPVAEVAEVRQRVRERRDRG